MYLWDIVQMLLEVFTVLLMKKILFKIFFQNKYYERRREVCFLSAPGSDRCSLPRPRNGFRLSL